MSINSSEVRAELGSPSSDVISDATLQNIIDDEETLYGSAARAAKIIYRHYSLLADKTAGDVSIEYSNRAELWQEIATELKNEATALQGKPMVGGISESDKELVESDDDYIDPFFGRNNWFGDDI